MFSQHHYPNEQPSASHQLEKDLAHLINVAGKMRMLSHKFVMCAALHDTACEVSNFENALSTTLEEFKYITQQLTHPCPKVGISEATARALTAHQVVSTEQKNCLSEFIKRASALQRNLTKPDTAQLGTFVSGDLLNSLNAMIENIRKVLDEKIAHAQSLQQPLLLAASSSVDQINRLAKNLQIVAMNASLEAQRAGENGAAFGEIAREMRGLSIKSLDQASRLANDIDEFKKMQGSA
jgi:methyl-accepting chemotaxis protein